MRIPPKPPSAPVQDGIIRSLKQAPQTKDGLAKELNCPMSSIRNALIALTAAGKIRPTLIQDNVHYILWDVES
ncbi:MAG: hypothetical protein AAFR31_19390 [Cyanobacteria bacterium J06627_8]